MRIVRTVYFEAQLRSIVLRHPSVSVPVEMELRLAASNPDVTKPAPAEQSDLRFITLEGFPDAPSVVLCTILRGDAATFYDVLLGAPPF